MATVGSGGGPNPVGRLKQVHNEWLNTKNFLEILESEMLQCKSRIHPRIANTLWTNLFNWFSCQRAMATVESGASSNPVACSKKVHNQMTQN